MPETLKDLSVQAILAYEAKNVQSAALTDFIFSIEKLFMREKTNYYYRVSIVIAAVSV